MRALCGPGHFAPYREIVRHAGQRRSGSEPWSSRWKTVFYSGDSVNMRTSSKIICPRSIDKMDVLSDGYKLHYATPAELKANGGVCAACAKVIRKHNSPSPRRGESEPQSSHEEVHTTGERHYEGGEDHGRIEVTQFDWQGVEELLGELEQATPTAREEAADLMSRIFTWIMARRSVKTPLVRMWAILAGIRPDLAFDGESYPQIARRLGITKAAFSKTMLLAQDHFRLKFARTRSAISRARMGAAQVGHPAWRKGERADNSAIAAQAGHSGNGRVRRYGTHPDKDSFKSDCPKASYGTA